MSLDITLTRRKWVSYNDGATFEEVEPEELFTANITHNMVNMALKADIYEPLWRCEKLDLLVAKDLSPHLDAGIKRLKLKPNYYRQFNPPNKWGDYDTFLKSLESLLEACEKYPEAILNCDR